MHLYMTARTRIAFIALCILCFGLPTPATGLAIPDAKLLANDQPVTLSARAVTYAATDFFYIEEDSGCMGIRVEKTAHGMTVGMRADVSGAMKTNTNRERYILATNAVHDGDGVVAPVGMNNMVLGGTDWQVVGTGGQRGVAEGIGLNNIGLLVKTWGHFQQVNATTFTVDDGTGYFIKCSVPSGTFLNSEWQYVSVTGISSLYKLSQYPYPTVYPPNVVVRDIDVSLPVEVVSVPGPPSGGTSPIVNASHEYLTSGSTCSQGHPVEYSFDWGDGTSSPWSTSTSASHCWSALGIKTVTVTARCQAHPSVSATSAGLQINVTDIEMVYIPAASFLMGNNGAEPYSYSNEFPQHSVNLSAYWIGKYEVTRGEYRQFMNAGGYSTQSYWSSAGWSWKESNHRTEPRYWAATQTWVAGQTFTQTDSHPVVGVSYYEAEAFCNWAGAHLPTEAEWEKAARWTGSYPDVYPWGNTWDAEKCNNWYDHNSAGGGYKRNQTAPVGSYTSGASPYGCHDMAGNVWEWCKDWYLSNYYSQTPTGGWSDPQGPTSGSYRILRGGSWLSYVSYDGDDFARCANRTDYGNGDSDPGDGNYGFGFRLAR